jgi:hypothetical protein
MIETELENESVILKRQTFNAQPAFGKPTARQASKIQSVNIKQSAIRNPQSAVERADDGIRTRDLRFTKPLLYQLSYVGA